MADGDLTLNDNPNIDTGYVESGGTQHRVHLIRALNGTLELNDDNYNVDTGYVTVNGKKHRVHLVAELGNSGGSIDYTTVVSKTTTMPVADSSNTDIVYMYTGETDATYTHGYIYECVKETAYTDSVTYEPATLSGTVVTSTTGALATIASEYITGDVESIVSGTLTYDGVGELWVFVGKDSEDNTVGTFQVYQQDYVDAGFTFTGTPEDGDVVAFTCTITDASTYSWQRLDVQPTGKEEVVTVSASTLTQELADNTIYNAGTLTALTITFPATPTASYISQVNFSSGTTATALTAPVDVVWSGDDIVSNVFVPDVSKRYSVMFFYDGVSMCGIAKAN